MAHDSADDGTTDRPDAGAFAGPDLDARVGDDAARRADRGQLDAVRFARRLVGITGMDSGNGGERRRRGEGDMEQFHGGIA